MPTPPFTPLNLSAVGNANAAVFNLNSPDTQLFLTISPGAPSFVGAQLVFEVLPIGQNLWIPQGGVESDTLSVISGAAQTPFVVSPDGFTFGAKFDISGCQAFRVWLAAITSGVVVAGGNVESPFANPPSGAALSYAVQLAILWQLQHLTFLMAQSDEKIAANWVTNPILPPGLPAKIWDVTG